MLAPIGHKGQPKYLGDYAQVPERSSPEQEPRMPRLPAVEGKRGFVEVGPVRRSREPRVPAHVLLCILAYHVRLHTERALAPLLFTAHDLEGKTARGASIVAPVRRWKVGERKVGRQRTEEGQPVRRPDVPYRV